MAQIIDGKAIAAKVKAQVKEEAAALVRERGLTPGLAVVLVGDNSASKVYVRNKERACKEVGFVSRKHVLPEDTSQEELLALIDALNGDSAVHGILVQLPLPKRMWTLSMWKTRGVSSWGTTDSCPAPRRGFSPC